MILVTFGLLYVTESSVLGAVRVIHVFCHFIIIIIIIVIIILLLSLLLLGC